MSRSIPRGLSITRGFTLVEVIIAFALLAMLTALLFSTFRYATRSTEVGTARNEWHEDMRRSQDFLRQHLEEMLPLRHQKELGQPMRLRGSPEKLIYVAPVISRIAEGGVLWWELSMQGQGEQRFFALRRAIMSGEEAEPPAFDEKDQSVLGERVSAVKFTYFDQPDPQLSGNWVDSWTDDQRLPNLIRIEIVAANGNPWPELVVAPQIAASVGCPGRWNMQQKRCVIPGAVR